MSNAWYYHKNHMYYYNILLLIVSKYILHLISTTLGSKNGIGISTLQMIQITFIIGL